MTLDEFLDALKDAHAVRGRSGWRLVGGALRGRACGECPITLSLIHISEPTRPY